MRTLFLTGLLAFLAALLITGLSKPEPLDTKLLRLQVEQRLPEAANELAGKPAGIQALLLTYADDPVLLAKARLALQRYPDMAVPILMMFGDDPAFQEALRRYGEDVVLPIHYFLNHEIFTLTLMRSLDETTRSTLEALRRLWGQNAPTQSAPSGPLSKEERGRYAIQFINAEGYGFLGQFVVSAQGEVGWLQTERVLEGINRFFAGGVRGLESKFRRDEAVTAGDVGWAALDVAVGVGAFKLLRLGRAGAAGRSSLTFSQRSAVVGAGLWRGSAIGARLVKYGAPAVLAYVAVRHPSVINAMLGAAAEKLGLPVKAVQVVGWTLILLPVIWVLHLLLRPLAWLISGLVGLLRWFDRLLRGRRSAGASA